MSYGEIIIALENIIVDKVSTVRSKQEERHECTNGDWDGSKRRLRKCEPTKETRGSWISRCKLSTREPAKGKCGFGKGQNWNEKGGESRTCWTCGKAGNIAAWCRKGGNKNLHATDEDDSENIEESTENGKDLQAWCLEESENEQWQEVISRGNKQRVKRANQALLLSVKNSHSSNPKKVVEVKDKWVK